jgi:hypothetical protein
MPFQYSLRLEDADDVAELARWSLRHLLQPGCQNSQGQLLCPIGPDWLVLFSFQDSQPSAQEEDFQVFFLFGQAADAEE